MTKQMQDKVCVITGGAGSIGAASAKLLVEEGAKVLLVDLGSSQKRDRNRGEPLRQDRSALQQCR
jgi:NAD(P)-dependent dehydrogenase (short-subunit alcohol dehydrogenase family)